MQNNTTTPHLKDLPTTESLTHEGFMGNFLVEQVCHLVDKKETSKVCNRNIMASMIIEKTLRGRHVRNLENMRELVS